MPRDRPQSRGLHFNRDDAVPNEITSSRARLSIDGVRGPSAPGTNRDGSLLGSDGNRSNEARVRS